MKVKQGSYIVTLKFLKGFVGNCGKENYCFKQKRDGEYMAPVLDLQGDTYNSHQILSFDCKGWLLEWRYATEEEKAEYDRLGKPYDVTTLNKKITPASLSLSEPFYIKYNESITEEAFNQLCRILNERIGPFIEHCGLELSYNKFKNSTRFSDSPYRIGYIRTKLTCEDEKQGWCLDNNTQGIKKEKFIEDFIPSTKYDPHTYEPQYNVGDYVITKGYSNTYDGRILKITEITTNGCKKYAYFEVIDGVEWGKSHNFRLDQIERKATQQEIDVYLKKSNPIYPKDYEAWLEYMKHKTFSNLKELAEFIHNPLTCNDEGVYQKIPGWRSPEKAQWIWDNILYPKTIDDVFIPIDVDSGVVITSGNTETWISDVSHYTSIGTNIPISTKDTKKTLSHQKPYIIKSPKKTSKFVRLTK